MNQEERPKDTGKKSNLFLMCLSTGSHNRQGTALHDMVTQQGWTTKFAGCIPNKEMRRGQLLKISYM